MITLLAREVAGLGHVVAGALSPLPAAAALLAQATRADPRDRPGQPALQPLRGRRARALRLRRARAASTPSSSAAARSTARPISISWRSASSAHPSVRFPGSFGSAYLYFLVPKIVLFREEHSRRSLVRRVDFISAPGKSPENVYRRGGPKALVTGLASFAFADRFRLVSIHPGHDLAELRAATGFDFDGPPTSGTTAPPAERARPYPRPHPRGGRGDLSGLRCRPGYSALSGTLTASSSPMSWIVCASA